jgi:hypothetical protein
MKKAHLRIFGLFLVTAVCAASIAIPLAVHADNASVSIVFTPPASGWFTSSSAAGSVTATTTTDNITTVDCTDDQSGLSVGGLVGAPGLSVSATLTVSGDGVHSINCVATDEQGHTGSNTYVVRIDSTAPNIAYASRTHDTTWTNQNVTVTWDCTDDTSGPASGSVSQTVSSEGTGQSASASCADNAGNVSATDTQSGINIDKTAPTVTSATPDRAANSFGWYTAPVDYTFNGTDGLSGINTCQTVTYSSPDSATATATGTCTDNAGNTSNSYLVGLQYDATPPTAALAASGTSGDNGWYINNPVIITASGSDISTVTCTPATQTQSTDTAGTAFNTTCRNAAGLTRDAAPLTIKLDTTPPTASLAVTGGDLGSNGWYTSNVTITASGSDISAVTCTPAAQTLTTDTAGTAFNSNCRNAAGLTQAAAPLTIKRDATNPGIVLFSRTAANANDWNNTDVSLVWNCSDALSLPVNAQVSTTVSSEGESQTANGTCQDNAGNTRTDTQSNINIDKTRPNVTGSAPARGPDSGTWYNHSITITFTGTDGIGSGIDTCTASTYSGPDGAGRTVSGTCTDQAGNQSAAAPSSAFNYDATAPTGVSGAPDRIPDSNGWYNHAVNIAFTGTDPASGIGSCTNNLYAGPDNVNISVNGVCTDLAGNTSAPAVSAAFKYDATDPGILLASRSPAPNVSGWNNTNVTVTWNCSDTLSGPASASVSQIVSTEGDGLTSTGTCQDNAGNTAQNTQTNIKIDKTDPTMTGSSRDRAPDSGIWYNHSISITFAGADGISGIDFCTTTTYSGPDGAGRTVSGTCTDQAGNQSAAAPSSAFNYDATDPGISLASRSPAPNTYGWNNTNVTVNWTCTDITSGPVAPSVSQTVSSEGAGQSASGTCTDAAGNTKSTNQTGINIDKTNPSASGAPSRAPDFNGWYNHALSVAFSGADALSGIASCSAAIPYSGPDRENIMAGTGFCTDEAGNVSPTVNASLFKYDATSPTAVVSVSAPDHGEWYNQPLTVSFTWSDNLSGVGTPCTTSQDYSGPDGSSIPVNGSCTDQAGNSASASKTIKYDATAPVSVSGAPDRAPDKNGWYNHAVNVAFAGHDATSGIDTCSAVLYISPDTLGTSVNGSCTDLAGNTSATVPSSTFKYDTTRPTATGSIAPANEYGWYNADVTVTFSGTDDLSGIDTCTDPVVMSTEGKEQSAVGFCKDLAGNVSSVASVYHINIDKTPPLITFIGSAPPPDFSGWNYTPVTLAWSCSDVLSGVVFSPVTKVVTSEGENQSAEGICKDKAGNASSDIQRNISIYLSSSPPAPPTETPTATATIEPTPLPGETPIPATATSEPAQAGASATAESADDTTPSGSPTPYYLLGGILGAGLLGGLTYFLLKKFRK